MYRQGVNSVSIVGRLPTLHSVHYQRFHCIYIVQMPNYMAAQEMMRVVSTHCGTLDVLMRSRGGDFHSVDFWLYNTLAGHLVSHSNNSVLLIGHLTKGPLRMCVRVL